jgi:subtilisin-like proprotein convertase family protein
MMPRRNPGRKSLRTYLNGLFRGDDRRRRDGRLSSHATTGPGAEALEQRSLLSSTTVGEVVRFYQSYGASERITSQDGFLTEPSADDPLQIAQDYLRDNANSLGLTSTDIDSLVVRDQYVGDNSGSTRIFFHQVVNGIPVVNGDVNVNISQNGEVINVGSSVLPAVGNTPASSPDITAIEAVTSLADEFQWKIEEEIVVRSADEAAPTKDRVLSDGGISLEDITAALRYVPVNGALELTWLVNVQTTDSQSWYDASVSASSGTVLNVADWVNSASYLAIAIPGENPLETPQTTIVDPQNSAPLASPFGWHDTNGAAGAEFTDTRGNNVNAQEDKNADNAGGTRPDGGAGLVFNFPFDPAQGAQQNESAAVVNLFYMNNYIHDVLYGFGFDEASGNFQSNNYGNGGIGGDQVEADALDGSGTNNANFATPPDGTSGRMQMFEFTFTTPTRDSDMSNFIIAHEFGHGLSNRLTGGPGNSGALSAAQSRGMGEGWSDFLALMMVQKPTDAQFDAYSTGNYVLGNPLNDPNGGIRDFPYSYNMAISPKTYGDFNPNTAPHPNGEIIAATLWDLNWLQINGNGSTVTGLGYDADLYNAAGTAGNIVTMNLFIEALATQPVLPTYLDFRDAMLSADQSLYGGANTVAIWTAFARRGFGWSADDGGSANSGNVTEAFDLPPGLLFEVEIIPSAFSEAGGVAAAIGSVRRPNSSNLTIPLVVDLTSSDTTELLVPAQVTIPVGRTSVSFPVDAVDDTILDGDQTVTVTASATGFNSSFTNVTVIDHETITAQFDVTQIREDAGPAAATLTLTRSNTDTVAPNTFAIVANELVEFDPAGTLVNSQPVPWPSGTRPAGEDARDLQRMNNGTIAVLNGTNTGFISIYDPVSTIWTHEFVNGLTADGTDLSSGGIGSVGNTIFVTDSDDGSNLRGGLRFDTASIQATRFATRTLGNRMFVKDVHGTDILEVDPVTGATINSIPMPTVNAFGFNTGMAFDGDYLWVLAGPIGNDQIYKMDPDDGSILEIHKLGGSNGWDGLAYLDGLLYVQDDFIHNKITVYDPIGQRVVRTLNIVENISGGLAAIRNPGALIATSTFGDEIYEISPSSGAIVRRWNSGFSTTEYGVGVLDGEIYIGEFIGSDLKVFSRDGVFQRSVTLTLAGVPGIFAIAGDDIKGITDTTYRYRDLSVGLDDRIYLLEQGGTLVGQFDPVTLQPTIGRDGFFSLSQAVNGIAVDGSGRIFGAGLDGLIYEFDAAGSVVASLDAGVGELTDIDVNVGGALNLTSLSGEIIKSTTDLSGVSTYPAGAISPFVTFGNHNSLPSGQIIVSLMNGDPTEISIPSQVIIPEGQQSITIPVDILDDAILDGLQVVVVTPSAAGYVGVSDSLDVLDVETIGVEIIPDELPESSGPAATMVRVFRSNVDGPFVFVTSQTESNSSPTTILDQDTVNSFIQFPEQTSRIQDVNVSLSLTHSWIADLDVYLVSPTGTRVELFTDVLSNESSMTGTVLDDQASQSILQGNAPYTGSFMPEGQLLDFNDENPSGWWHLEITDDNRSDFGQLISWSLIVQTVGSEETVVQLTSSDTSEADIVGTVVIPENRSEVFVPLDVFDDNILDGTQPVTISVFDSNLLNFEYGSDLVNITDDELMTFSVTDTVVSEAGGAAVSIGRVTRFNSDISAAYTVNLSSSDTTELTVPASVTILAGETFAEFPIDAVDDAIFDGSQFVTITASAPAYGPDMNVEIEVEDLEPSLRLSTQSVNVFENSVSFTMTVTRLDQSDLSSPQPVVLSSSDVTELTVPPGVTIPIGFDSVNFTVVVVDDTFLDGTQQVTLSATGAGIGAGNIILNVLDHETLTITVSHDSFFENPRENQSAGVTLLGTVARSNLSDLALPLVVNLSSSDTGELTVPPTVTIPAGVTSATFGMTAIDDLVLDGPQLVTISATATGYVDGNKDITVLDHEPPQIVGPPATTPNPKPTIAWLPIPGATRYDVWVDNLSTGINQIIRDTNVVGNTFVPVENLGIGDYRVWVRAYDVLEQPGFWSNAYFFRINTAGTITAPSDIGDLAHPSFPRISWNALADVSFYDLWVDDDTTGTSQVVRVQDLTTTTYLSTEGLGSGTYRAWVRGINSAGLPGRWSNAASFTVLSAPVISTPVGGTFDRTPTVNWNAIAGATQYDLWISNLTTQTLELRNQFVTTNSFTMPSDLNDGRYAVWVRAFNGTKHSEWSDVKAFQIAQSPTITSPTNGESTSANPTFVWSSIDDAQRYELWVTRLDGNNNRVIHEQFLTTTSFTAGGALDTGNYRVWVRAVSNMGELSQWSRSVDFSVASVESNPGAVPFDNDGSHLLTAVMPVLSGNSSHRQQTGTRVAAPAEPAARELSHHVAVHGAADGNGLLLHDEVMADWDSADWWRSDDLTIAATTAGSSHQIERAARRKESIRNS